ncbi:MAG: proteasome subunit beta [bacterium]|nr:proteasome subunit beta [bacterium]
MTTILGIKYNNGVLLASDMQATYSHIRFSRERKIYPITRSIAVATAGMVGDLQTIVKQLKVEATLYELNNKKPISPKALTNFLSLLLNSLARHLFYQGPLVEFIVGGYGEGPELYSVDAAGGTSEHEDFTALGSGIELALSYLEAHYRPDIDERAAVALAVGALQNTIKREIFTGFEPFICIIDSSGYREIRENEIREILGQG